MSPQAMEPTPHVVDLLTLAEMISTGVDGGVESVGGKAHNLGKAVALSDGPTQFNQVPTGFVITSAAYRSLHKIATPTGARSFHPSGLVDQIIAAAKAIGLEEAGLAVRSSASVEDGEVSSFAGSFASVLNVRTTGELLNAYVQVTESLYGSAATSLMQSKGISSDAATMPVLVQQMVGDEQSIGGVLLTGQRLGGISGIIVEGTVGGAAAVVGGTVTPDSTLIDTNGQVLATGIASGSVPPDADGGDPQHDSLFGPVLLDRLARLASFAESVVGSAADVEWLWDPTTDQLYLLQLRRLVQPINSSHGTGPRSLVTEPTKPVVQGLGVGSGEFAGPVLVADDVHDAMAKLGTKEFVQGFVLVVELTSPEWLPVLTEASALVTDVGGRTSHGAIMCRELGIPGVVGCGNAMELLADGVTDVVVKVWDDGRGEVRLTDYDSG